MTKKRFISGAICPKCQATDTLRWWRENEVEQVECAACHYTEMRTPRSVDESEQLSETTKQQVIGIFKPD